MMNVEFLMRYHPQFYIGCKSTIKNRDKQKNPSKYMICLDFCILFLPCKGAVF